MLYLYLEFAERAGGSSILQKFSEEVYDEQSKIEPCTSV